MVNLKPYLTPMAIILLALTILYTGASISKGSLVTPTDVEIFLEQPEFPSFEEQPQPEQEQDLEIKLEVIPNPGCVGDTFRGTVTTNMPSAYCRMWFQPHGEEARKFADFQLDEEGTWSYSQRIDVSGSADFKAACVLEGSYAVSDRYTLVVEDCDSSEDSSSNEPYEGMPCSQVPPGKETCVQGACEEGSCVFVPGDLMIKDKCECR